MPSKQIYAKKVFWDRSMCSIAWNFFEVNLLTLFVGLGYFSNRLFISKRLSLLKRESKFTKKIVMRSTPGLGQKEKSNKTAKFEKEFYLFEHYWKNLQPWADFIK